MSAKQRFDGNALYIFAGYFINILKLVILVQIWKSLAQTNADLGDFTISQLLTYTLMAAIWHPQLNIVTPATASLWEGSIINRYVRPMPVLLSLVAETIGRQWVTGFVFFSLPVFLCANLAGISIRPASPADGCYSCVSLLLSVIIGFALDFLFASVATNLKNGCWAIVQIRESITSLLSGAFIPFSLMPPKIGRALSLLPFGSIASAPLSIYTGIGDRWSLISIQLTWAVILSLAVIPVLRKSEERMISFGG